MLAVFLTAHPEIQGESILIDLQTIRLRRMVTDTARGGSSDHII